MRIYVRSGETVSIPWASSDANWNDRSDQWTKSFWKNAEQYRNSFILQSIWGYRKV